MRFERRPLLVRDPLDVAKEIFAIAKLVLRFSGLMLQPRPRGIDVPWLRRPHVPRLAVAVLFDQCAKKNVVVEPALLLFAKIPERRFPILARTLRKVRESFFQQPPL